ncbi:hypothetical protein P9112_007723 [Eukaryota sp. TZLM1-RC]
MSNIPVVDVEQIQEPRRFSDIRNFAVPMSIVPNRYYDDASETQPTTEISSPRQRSDVWPHVTDKQRAPGKKTCKHCHGPSWNSQSLSTTTIKRHLDSQHPTWKANNPIQSNTLFGTPQQQKKQKQDMLQGLFTKVLVDCDLPFNIVEHESFQMFIAALNPEFELKKKDTQKKFCEQLFEEEQSRLKDTLQASNSKIALTADFWSSVAKSPFLGVTAHWLDNDFKPCHVALDMRKMPYPHDESHLISGLSAIVKDFHLEERIISVTTDNELAISNAANWISNGRRCSAHVFNIFVQDYVNLTADFTRKIKEFVLELHGSHKLYQNLKCLLKDAGYNLSTIPMYVETRWNSFYQMLATYREVANCVQQLLQGDQSLAKYLLTDIEKLHLKIIVEILVLFKDATDDVESESCTIGVASVSMNLIIQKARDLITAVNIPDCVKKASTNILKKWESGSRNRVPYRSLLYDEMTLIGTILDPRIKNNPSLLPVELQEVDADFSQLNRMIQSVSSTSQPTIVEAGTKQTVRKKGLFNKVAAKKSNVMNLHVENELKCYLKEGIVDYETDPYLWWMENVKKYPSLAKIAKDYLVVQPSSASSERLFSAASQIISKKRARLNEDTARCLLCLRSWYKKQHIMVDS